MLTRPHIQKRISLYLLAGFSLQNHAWFERHSTVSSRMNDQALLYSFGLQLRDGLGTVPRNDYSFAQ